MTAARFRRAATSTIFSDRSQRFLDRGARRADIQSETRPILGDLRHVALMPGAYDVIYNAYGLEHVEGAERVLENFLTWLKPDGLLKRHLLQEEIWGVLLAEPAEND